MDLSAQKDHFSRAYAIAVASAAGFAYAKPDPDDDSIDLTISASRKRYTVGPKLDVQLKCHAMPPPKEDSFPFDLEVKNYTELRGIVTTPRILVVVAVADHPNDWMRCYRHGTILRYKGFWYSLRNEPETTNTSTVRLKIPTANVFTPAALVAMFNTIAAGGAP